MQARLFLISALFLISGACAKISAPSGGPRDKLPPVVIKSIPENGAKRFKGKGVAITFNEYVVLDNISDKFLVSPPMKMKPRVFIKGKNVNVEFDEKLKDSTTYTMYFLDAIKDLNEGNIIDNYQFVFSTGNVIDSLSVTGNVRNSFNLEAPEKTQVLMYHELADSAVVKHIPDYISRVDQNGYFRIDNVKAGNYRLYAIKDADNSKNYNNREEEFAFMESPVLITPEKDFRPVVKDTTKVKKVPDKIAGKLTVKVPEPPILTGEYQLLLFTAQKKNHYLAGSSRDLKYQLIYTLSLAPDSMKFEFSIPGTTNGAYIIEKSRNRDTLKVWLTDSTLYSKQQITTIVKYPFTDTLKKLGYKEDTILMRFLAPRAPRVAKVKKPVFDVNFGILGGVLKPGQQIVLNAKTPFRQPDTTRIKLYQIIDSVKKTIPYALKKDSINSCRYLINANLQQGKNYMLVADSASFSSIYNEFSDSAGIKFSVKEPDSYSKLTLNIKNYEGDRIIQLLDKGENLIQESKMKKDGKLVFPLLESGFYRIRVIYDLNSDGTWNTGDFDSGQQPEPVSYYPGEVELKTNYEIDQDWDMGLKNVKDQKLVEKKKTR